jgi:hypothetical protein
MKILKLLGLGAPLLMGMLAAALTGCVSTSRYEEMRKGADELQKSYQAEHKRTVQLVDENWQQKEKIAQLEASLQREHAELARLESEWKEMRDNVLKFKVQYELDRTGSRDKFRVEPEHTAHNKAAGQGLDAKERLKELQAVLQHVKTLLE